MGPPDVEWPPKGSGPSLIVEWYLQILRDYQNSTTFQRNSWVIYFKKPGLTLVLEDNLYLNKHINILHSLCTFTVDSVRARLFVTLKNRANFIAILIVCC